MIEPKTLNLRLRWKRAKKRWVSSQCTVSALTLALRPIPEHGLSPSSSFTQLHATADFPLTTAMSIEYSGEGNECALKQDTQMIMKFSLETEADTQALAAFVNQKVSLLSRQKSQRPKMNVLKLDGVKNHLPLLNESSRDFIKSQYKTYESISFRSLSKRDLTSSLRSNMVEREKPSSMPRTAKQKYAASGELNKGNRKSKALGKSFLNLFSSDKARYADGDSVFKSMEAIAQDTAVKGAANSMDLTGNRKLLKQFPAKKAIPRVLESNLRKPAEFLTHKSSKTFEFLLETISKPNTLPGALISRFSKKGRTDVVRNMFKINLDNRSELIRFGQLWDQFCIIESGSILLYHQTKGKSISDLKKLKAVGDRYLHSKLKPGDSFGETCLIYVEPSRYEAISVGKGCVWSITKRCFGNIAKEETELKRKVKENLLQEISKKIKMIETLQSIEKAEILEAMEFLSLKKGEKYPDQNSNLRAFVYIVSLGKRKNIDVSLEGMSQKGKYGKIIGIKGCTENIISNGGYTTGRVIVTGEESLVLILRFSDIMSLQKVKDLKSKTHSEFFSSRTFESASASVLRQICHANWNSERTGISSRVNSEPTLGISDSFSDFNLDLASSNRINPLKPEFEVYKLKFARVLGEGSYGRVHLATYLEGNKLKAFAVKIAKLPALYSSQEKIKQFDREKHIMSKLSSGKQSKHIVKLYHTFMDAENIFYVMEFCAGGDLGQLLRNSKTEGFPATWIKFFLACITAGLQAVHDHNIIYRDLKPGNILIDAKGYLKLCDFGTSKRSQRTFTNIGTAEYMAPELSLSMGYGKSVDYWALGITAFELGCGFTPFYSPDTKILHTRVIQHKDTTFNPGNICRLPAIADAFPENKPTEFDNLSSELCSMITSLLTFQPSKRLGCLSSVNDHPYFKDFEWNKLNERELEAPFQPEMNQELAAGVENISIVPSRGYQYTLLPDADQYILD